MCIGFIDLNRICPKDSYLLPRIGQMVDATSGYELLNFMDAFFGYNQIQMAPEDEKKITFITDRGLYYYKMMSFGLKNTEATDQWLVDKTFKDQLGHNMEAYVDDMLVKSRVVPDHISDLQKTFDILHRFQIRLNPAKYAFGVTVEKFFGFMISQRGIEVNPEKNRVILEMTPSRIVREVQRLTDRIASLNRFVSRSVERCLPIFQTLRQPKDFQWTIEYQKTFEELKQHFSSPPLLTKPQPSELLLYLAVSPMAINYHPRPSIKAQVLANFILECTIPNEQSSQDEEGSRAGKGSEAGESSRNEEADVGSDPEELWTLHVDGSSNASGAGAGLILTDPEGNVVRYALRFEFPTTNNEAEYEALLARLKVIRTENTKADALSKLAAMLLADLKKRTYFERTTILSHKGSKDKQTTRYVLYDDKLYKRSFSLPLLKKCDRYQRNSNIQHQPAALLTPISTPWPFAQWGMDILCPFPLASDQHKFFLVAIDYFTKWIEVEPLARITKARIKDFVLKPIICRYGLSRVLIMDNDRQFSGARLREFCRDHEK
ncbi:uncharacterized protein [Elaeis guineensis]|uniref:uncharacterized protein n=1 Tax=Elaeis guineensis var. tenera TaxID=51953 RepID=UPI003C6D3A9E